MRILIDMNLSPAWVSVLDAAGHSAVHWSRIGSPTAKDSEILAWARQYQYIVFTHDLDLGAILAATDADAPSVVQVRTQDPTPAHCTRVVTDILQRYAGPLSDGALISVDESRARIHVLPLKKGGD